jgi:ribonuclease BN (tRNA processing enzyme)
MSNKNKLTRIILLGSGVPTPNPKRMGACVAILIEGKPLLLDCGRGAVTQLVSAGIDPAEVEQIFITHHHLDHTIGLPDVLFGSWIVGRNTAVEVFGPPGTKFFVRSIFEAFKLDMEARTRIRSSRIEAIPKEIDEGLVWKTSNCQLRAVRVNHIANSFGYRIDTNDRSLVFSGDTQPCPALVELSKGADVLIHEVLFSPEFEESGAPYGRHPDFVKPGWFDRLHHTKPHEVGKIAAEAGVKKLVLTHLWSNRDEDKLRDIVSADFSGEILVGKDLLEI